ncbi:venom carboxylesterase-6-like isoform X1 [Bradysia coprophila]|uniref:venom carboxylesterase-6-like isoform X1 n=1 Tax=Bradysia coprophila TaxID=38358 RepID=UPI00187DA80E|nr:venom carboxylesterase-6-like isoform X1 [Bradysia coprophila]
MLPSRITILFIIFEFTWQINANFNCEHHKVVTTRYGRVRGCISKTLLEQRPIVSFTGIPYAKPPVGNRRFEQSVPPEPWNATLDAFQYKNVCNQMEAGKPIGNEDCLYINVFTPDTTFSKRLPVIFFIFGGGFYAGSANIYGPELLLDHDVILVTFNYRLGPFGFFSLGNRDYSGNLALKDQLLALKWVRDNIHSFGGDKTEITTHGWSAGCRSVSLHMASPASQGLFNRAICFSASALIPWILSDVKDHRDIAKDFAISHGFQPSNDQQLIDYLKNVDADKLSTLTNNSLPPPGTNEIYFGLPWGPVIESASSKNPFLLSSPVNYFNKENYGRSSMDTLIGYVDAESYVGISDVIQDPSLLAPFDKEFRVQLPLFGLNYSFSDLDYPLLSNEVRQFYFGNESVTTQVPQLSSITNDLMSYPVHRAVKLQSKVSCGRTFYYIFSVDLMLSRFKRLSNAKAHGLTGNSTHGDDIFYLFKIKNWDEIIAPGTYESLSLDSKEVSVIKMMTGIVANFATTGHPTLQDSPIDWKEVDKDEQDINYVTITEEGLRAGVNPNCNNYAFWDKFFIKHQQRLGCSNCQ